MWEIFSKYFWPSHNILTVKFRSVRVVNSYFVVFEKPFFYSTAVGIHTLPRRIILRTVRLDLSMSVDF